MFEHKAMLFAIKEGHMHNRCHIAGIFGMEEKV